jgi:peptidoglycan/LPS O-acetylase OafA/YrhL
VSRRIAALSVAVLSLLLVAVPALAAEEGAADAALDTSGLVWAFGAGVVVAIVGVASAYAGSKDEAPTDGHHH